jgi:hypothetical protein
MIITLQTPPQLGALLKAHRLGKFIMIHLFGEQFSFYPTEMPFPPNITLMCVTAKGRLIRHTDEPYTWEDVTLMLEVADNQKNSIAKLAI